MMLITSFGASIGGMATPVGTPPNLIGIGMLEKLVGVDVTFFQWMLIGVPLDGHHVRRHRGAVLLHGRAGGDPGSGQHAARRRRAEEARARVSRGQRNVLIAFGMTVALWITAGRLRARSASTTRRWRAPTTQAMPESIAAMVGALLLFVLPLDWRTRRFTLTWDEAIRIDWGIVLLYGGGLAMGELAFQTGLAEAMGQGITGLAARRTARCADADLHGRRDRACPRPRPTPRRPT